MGKYKSQQILRFIWNRTAKSVVAEHETLMFIVYTVLNSLKRMQGKGK